MARYLIHTVPKREWYVRDYLVPSMVQQGIAGIDITVYVDNEHKGNLRACMDAFKLCEGQAGGTWHLQDDVIISHDFKEKTEKYDNGIVCGFKSRYDGNTPYGTVPAKQMWFSFPCIRIPNNIASECADWVINYMIGNPVYREWWEKGVNDDLLFRQYVWNTYPNAMAYNLKPNIVDHIDYLIGGTVNSNARKIVKIRSEFWEDEYLVNELENKLKGVIK